MDYSTVPSDSDHLHDSSPWGSSSPRAERSSFPPNSSDPSDSPAPNHQQFSYTRPQENDESTPSGDRIRLSAEGSSSDQQTNIFGQQDLSERLHKAQLGDPNTTIGSPADSQ